jgi:hypothetical protein
MILHAHSHKSGAKKLAIKYELRQALPKEYITEKDLRKYGAVIDDKERLLYALQQHKDIYAYVLPNLKVYFHPDSTIPVIGEAFKKYFSGLL